MDKVGGDVINLFNRIATRWAPYEIFILECSKNKPILNNFGISRESFRLDNCGREEEWKCFLTF